MTMSSTTAVTVTAVEARRIALLGDTHFMSPDGGDVPIALLEALHGVDLIVHLGHVSSPGALDRLELVAPVLAVRTALDDRLFGEQYADGLESLRTSGVARVIEAGGLRIGAIHDLVASGSGIKVDSGGRLVFSPLDLDATLGERFGGPVDVVAFAATHIDTVAHRHGVLFVNPGSPNLPGGKRQGGSGTIAILDLFQGAASVEFVEVIATREPAATR